MAIESLDNFSLYGTGSGATDLMLNGLYASVTNEAGSTPLGSTSNTVAADPDPVETGVAFRMGAQLNNGSDTTTNFTNLLRKVLSAPRTAVGVGQRIWFETLPSSTTEQCCAILEFKDASNNILLVVEVTPTGALTVWRGTITESSSSVAREVDRASVLGTTGPVIVANAWQHVEVKVAFSSTVGTVDIHVEGASVLSLTGVNTSASGNPCAAVAWHNFRGGSLPPVWWTKSHHIWNTLGSYNNDFMGPVGIYTLLPNGDDALNWVPVGAANGWSILDDVPPDDATYIEADTTPPAAYVATLTNLPPDLVSIRGVQSVIRGRKADGGDGNIQVGFISGASTGLGADRPMTTSYTFWADVSEENPDTSAPYTPAAVDALKLSVDRTV